MRISSFKLIYHLSNTRIVLVFYVKNKIDFNNFGIHYLTLQLCVQCYSRFNKILFIAHLVITFNQISKFENLTNFPLMFLFQNY